MIMVGSFKIVFNQSCFLSVENNNMYETNMSFQKKKSPMLTFF